jgi:hypothetical protein
LVPVFPGVDLLRFFAYASLPENYFGNRKIKNKGEINQFLGKFFLPP